jgi:hypothetical protein
MSIEPAEIDAIRLLRNDMAEHLENAEYLAEPPVTWDADEQQRAGLVIEQLVTVVRGVLITHDIEIEDGKSDRQCRTCETPWPCETYGTLHRLVKNPDSEMVRILKTVRGLG